MAARPVCWHQWESMATTQPQASGGTRPCRPCRRACASREGGAARGTATRAQPPPRSRTAHAIRGRLQSNRTWGREGGRAGSRTLLGGGQTPALAIAQYTQLSAVPECTCRGVPRVRLLASGAIQSFRAPRGRRLVTCRAAHSLSPLRDPEARRAHALLPLLDGAGDECLRLDHHVPCQHQQQQQHKSAALGDLLAHYTCVDAHPEGEGTRAFA